MSASNPRWYKWYPTEETDLGEVPFEGDWSSEDRIYQVGGQTESGDILWNIYYKHAAQLQWGRNVTTKVGGRIKNVWTPGVKCWPTTVVDASGEEVPAPVWIMYCGDGLCLVKLPEGEQVEPYEPEGNEET
jgi:hypothetical protein